MNEFVAFLKLLWEIVKFLLDAASYAICFALLMAACLLPWRAYAIHHELCYGEDKFSRSNCVYQFFRTAFETVALIFCLPSLVIPTRLAGVVYLLTHASVRQEMVSNKDCDYVGYLFGSPFFGIAEVVAGICSLIALLSVTRLRSFVQLVAEAAGKSGEWNDAGFNSELAATCVAGGFLAILDLMLLPLVFVVGVTVWRAPPMVRAMCKSKPEVTRAVIFRQFVRLLVDVLLVAPAALLGALTVYRLLPLLRRAAPRPAEAAPLPASPARLEEGVSGGVVDAEESVPLTPVSLAPAQAEVEEETAEGACEEAFALEPLQRELVRAAGLLLLDAACLPMILPLLATGYRFGAVAGGLPGTAFHSAVLEQFVELLIDVPFLFAALLVVCSVYRADLVLKLRRDDAGTAGDRRRAAGQQLLRVVGDVASLVPCAVITLTVYRVCPLLLSLKARMAQMLREEAEMRLIEWRFDMPRPKGKPRFVVRAAKSPNLCGVRSMQLQVAGDGFWTALAEVHGGMKAALGRAMLPLKLKDGKEVNFSAIERGRADAEVAIELDVVVKQSTVLKFLRKLPAQTELLLQLEASVEAERGPEAGSAAGRRKLVLLAVPCRVAEMAEAVSSEGFSVEVPEGEATGEAAGQRLAQLRGVPKLRRDLWLPLVLAEFLQVLLDVLHLFIAMVLLLAPWRLAVAARRYLEPVERREARPVRRTLGALASWNKACSHVLADADRLANRYSKAAAEEACMAPSKGSARCPQPYRSPRDIEQGCESCIGCCCCVFCPCCPNYNDWDSEDWEVVRPDGRHTGRRGDLDNDMNMQLKQLSTSLVFARRLLRSARKAWPDGSAWEGLPGMVDAHLQRRSEAFFWMLLLHEVNVLAAKRKITQDEHARVVQAIRSRALPLVHGAGAEWERLRETFRLRLEAAATEGRWGCKGKGKSLLFSILRKQLVSAITDVLSILLALLLLLTLYRLPCILEEARRNSDAMYVKEVIKREAIGLAMDLLRLLQLLLLTCLLVVTFVKLPDFLARLQPAQGLRKARDCALEAATELAVGIGELLLLLTAWKTYRLLVSALVFGVLCPAAMLALALPGAGSHTRGRFWLASACWLGLVAAGCVVPGVPVTASLLALMAVAFAGLCLNRVRGWWKPRGGQDSWSPVVRCSLPNLLALLTIACDAVSLAWVGVQTAGGASSASSLLAGNAPLVALGVVGLTVLLETIPMVSEEEEQEAIVTSQAWRAATTLCKEALFPFAAAALAPEALELWYYSAGLLFYVAVVLLGPAAWDFDLPYRSQLDIRCVGLGASGRRLLMVGAILANALHRPALFSALAAAAGAWALAWAPWGCSSLWPEALRLGVAAGAVAAAAFAQPGGGARNWYASYAAWAAACGLAMCTAAASQALRRQRLAASKVPAAFRHFEELRGRLCVWGGEAPPALRADTDVKGTARRLLEFEEQLPMERLRPEFYAERHAWRQELTDAKDYDAVLAHLERLKSMVSEPATRVLLRQVLARSPVSGPGQAWRQLGQPLAGEIVGFAVPPIEVTLPQPLKGWEYGRLDLDQLRSVAFTKASEIPARLHTKAARPTTIGRKLRKKPSVMAMTAQP